VANRSRTRIPKSNLGNPFFREEIVQALFEEGTLVRNGAIKLDTLKVATTVQAILAAHPLIYCAPGGIRIPLGSEVLCTVQLSEGRT